MEKLTPEDRVNLVTALLKQVQPTGKAKFVAFESAYDPKAMLTPREAGIALPYVEGLRLDEAMHPLTLLAVGLWPKSISTAVDRALPAPVAAKTTRADNAASPSAR